MDSGYYDTDVCPECDYNGLRHIGINDYYCPMCQKVFDIEELTWIDNEEAEEPPARNV